MFSAALKSGAAAAPTDPNFENVTLLLHGDGTNGAQNNTFLDSSTNNFTITRNGNTTQGSFSPYGNLWSNYFTGTNTNKLTTPSSSQFAMNNFTIECYINWQSISSIMAVCDIGGYIDGISFRASDAGLFVWLFNNVYYSPTYNWVVGQWYHIAFVRSGSTLYWYVDGVCLGTTSASSSQLPTSSVIVSGIQVGGVIDNTKYISNLRVVNSALYTGANFTPSGAPLTAISGTQLLTCQSNRFIDNSSNNFALTVGGTPSVQRFSPFAPTAAYSTATIGGSGYFDGTTAYLNTPAVAALDLDGTNYTIEAWVYLDGSKTTNTMVFADPYYVLGISLNRTGAGDTYVYTGDGTTWTGVPALISSSNLRFRCWNHVAFVQNAVQIALYHNGVQVASTSNGSLFPSGFNGRMFVGAVNDATEKFAGYMSGVRITRSALYNSTFTPPTAPFTQSGSLLLNFTNGAIFDNAMMNDLETVGNAQISTSVSRFGTGSMYFAGGADFLKSSPSIVYGLGTENFTIELWYYPIASSGPYPRIFEITQDPNGAFGAGSWGLMDRGIAGSNYGFFAYNITPSGGMVFTSSASVVDGAWVHLALVRNGTNITLYVNGVANGSIGTSTSLNTGPSYVWVGGTATAEASSNSYIDDFRITKGVVRYGSNFTPPTAAFPNN